MRDPMITLAAQRGLVRLDTGRQARLLYWPKPAGERRMRRTSSGRERAASNQARVEFVDTGKQLSVPIHRIVEVCAS